MSKPSRRILDIARKEKILDAISSTKSGDINGNCIAWADFSQRVRRGANIGSR
jgi:hypothetical protein